MGRGADLHNRYAWLLALMLAGSAALVSVWTVDAFMLPKITLYAVAVVVALTNWMWRVARDSRLSIPFGWPIAAVAGFVVAAAVVTASSTNPWLSLIGAQTRYSGLFSYLTYGCVFLIALSVADRYVFLARSTLVGAGPCLVIGLLQAAGFRPIELDTGGLPVAFATFGNVNFAGAWAGIVAALSIATALASEEQRGWRVYAAFLTLTLAIYCVATTTSQAVVVFFSTALFVSLVTARSHPGLNAALRRRPFQVSVGAVLALLVAGVGFLAFFNLGRIVASFEQSLVERPYFWDAAVGIWRDHPFLGTGLDTYGQFFPRYRSIEHAAIEGAGTADAPHSVPLAMLSNGGALLASTYLAFVMVVGFVVLRGLLKSDATRDAQLIGWGGVWLGYQIQSLVSFDVPALALLHFVAAGVLVGRLGGVRWRQTELPNLTNWTGSAPARSAALRRSGNSRLLKPATVVAAVTLGWLAIQPLRADLVTASAGPLTQEGRYADAAIAFERAGEIDPSNAEYLALAAKANVSSGRLDQSLLLMKEAADRNRGQVEYPLLVARIAAELGRSREAAAWYRESLWRDPYRVEVLSEASEFFLERGDTQTAERLASRALQIAPDNVESQDVLSRAQSMQSSR